MGVRLIARGGSYRDPDGTLVPITDENRSLALEANDRIAAAGERVMVVAQRDLDPASFDPAGDLLGLVENVAREQLTPIEEARAYAVLIDEFSLSLGEVAERVGRSKPSVSNRIRLLELPDDVLGMVERGQLTEGHARAVLAVPDHEGRRRLAREIVRRGLSVRAAEQRAKWAGARQRPRTHSAPVDPALAERVRNAIEQLTGRHARVVPRRVELPFGDEHDLAELVESLENAAATMADRSSH